MIGKWRATSTSKADCGFEVGEFCMCFTCVCWKYKGCPFACPLAWTCGKGTVFFGTGCTLESYKSNKDKIEVNCMICKERWTRDIGRQGAPTGEEMART